MNMPLTPDLTNPVTFRDLSKPIGALNQERLEFFKVHTERVKGGFILVCLLPGAV